VTQLPQLTAAFHSFVGLAACLTCVGQYIQDAAHFAEHASGTVDKTAIFLGTFIGGVTVTGTISSLFSFMNFLFRMFCWLFAFSFFLQVLLLPSPSLTIAWTLALLIYLPRTSST
jgi:NAD/NADP transhydrogenase beta subunit